MRPARLAALLSAIVLIVAACTGAATPSSGGSANPSPGGSPAPSNAASPPPSSSPDTLILRVANEGGFLAPNAARTQLPIVSVYADGRIITTGAVPAIYPGPLVPALVYRSVGPDGAAAILRTAVAAGLAGADTTYPPGPAPDAPMIVITVGHDGTRTISRFGFLDAFPGQQPLDSDPAGPVRAAASALVAKVTGTDTFGGTSGPSGTYQPLGYQLFVSPGAPQPTDPSLARPPVAWPLSTPLASFGQADLLGGAGARVGLVSGADAQTLAPILAGASQLTGFTSAGGVWTIAVRPLLPDEVTPQGG